MKKYIHYIFCILCIGFFTGCMLEEEAVENMDDNLVHMIFTAMVEDGDAVTKTILDENEVAGVRSVLWSPGDEIGIATYGGTYYQFKNTLEEPAANGVFEGSVSQDNKYYSIYPYKKDQKMSTSVSVTIPTQQTYKPNSFDGSAAPMVGKGNQAEPLHFMNLCGALAVQLTGSETVKSIIFQATSGEKVSGEGAVDPDYADYPVLAMSETAEDYAVLDCGEGVQLSGIPTSFHFVLPPGKYSGFKLIIATTDGQFMEKSTEKQLTIKRSIMTQAAAFEFESNVDNITNLSERGHSNCYIVPQPGYYTFDANVLGNGEYGILQDAGYHTDNPNIVPESVDLLWEDTNGIIKLYFYNPHNGKVSVLIDAMEGNALLAAKDTDGNIIWSWHLWITDEPSVQIYKNSAGTYEVLDRNIGATRADRGEGDEWKDSMGLMYFWGRKDPFRSEGYDSVSGLMTLESSISNPTARHTTGSWNSRYSSWMGQYNHNNRVWSETQKTIYDPCPVGYRVVTSSIFSGFTSTGAKSDNVGDFIVSEAFDYGWSFYIDENKAEDAWYPVCYYMRWSDGCECQTENGYVWTSDYDELPNKPILHFSSTQVEFGDVYQSDGHGYPVRCMKDDGYVDLSCPKVEIVGFEDVTTSSTKLIATVTYEGVSPVKERGFIYGLTPDLSDGIKVVSGSGNGEFSSIISGLSKSTRYYFKAYAANTRGESQSEMRSFMTRAFDDIIDLSAAGTANSYIVSKAGTYSIATVKGNSSVPVGKANSAEVLWESRGGALVPMVGTLITAELYQDEKIIFDVLEPFKEGNAVIAAKDALGTILWSWHIWLTDQPQEQIYLNNAGTMMDRNLGVDDEDDWGLYYQWGRKDPFLRETDCWPVPSGLSETIEYATEHPMTFISGIKGDEERWQSEKTIYDPCPSGWRVPDGGDTGVWALAGFCNSDYDSMSYGIVFQIENPATTWYPVSGWLSCEDKMLNDPTFYGGCWSATSSDSGAYSFTMDSGGGVHVSNRDPKSRGYNVRCFKENTGGGVQIDLSSAENLASDGTANSYIVSSAGTYCIPAVKGNSSESVGPVASAEVLWESFGTEEKVFKGNLVSGARYENGKIYFKIPDSYREGNAVIAAKDASGTILWSWHIWLTDEPEDQVYYNNAGTMMDRNLGATSATPGDVGALGLLYQWGRKDPFLGSSSISSSTVARSTLIWPSAVSSDSSNGTIEYAVEHPTIFITSNSSNYDWYYTGSSSTDNTRWQSDKTIYDPCPVGWRVPDGGDNGVWSAALGSSSSYSGTYDSTNAGMNISGKFGSASTIWYPVSGSRNGGDGALNDVGNYGYCWSVTPDSRYAYSLSFYYGGSVYPADYSGSRARGFSVRCLQESE